MGTPRSPSTDFYGIFGISRTACKAYKSIVMKLHPHPSHHKSNHHSNHVSTTHRSLHDDKSSTAAGEEDDDDPMSRRGLRPQSKDDSSVFKRRESLFSRSGSRRSHTPQARPTYLSSSASSNRRGSSGSFHRSTSRRDEGGGSSHGGGMRGLKSRPFSENASPMTSPFSSPKERDRGFVSPFKGLSSPSSPLNNLSRSSSPINGVTSSSPLFSKSVSRRERDAGVTSSVPLSKSTSLGGDAAAGATMGRSTSRRSTTPIVFSQSVARRKPSPVERKLECTLEELCHGGVKNIKITRDIITDEGLIVQEEETLRVNIKPGWKKGTKITFEGKGNEKPGYLPEDIIFLIEEKRHPLFKRRGDDLEITVEIPLVKALTGCTLSVPLLDGEKMALSIRDIIFHGFEKAIKGQGMPNAKEGGKRGDLRITFLVKFPKELGEEQRFMVSDILKDCSSS